MDAPYTGARDLRSAVPPIDLDEAIFHVEDLPVNRVGPMELRARDIPFADKGIYTFIRSGFGCTPVRLYLGVSTSIRLTERVKEQLHKRRWAGRLLMFDLTGLQPETLFTLESRLLVLASEKFQLAVWDNQRGLFKEGSTLDGQIEIPSAFEKLAQLILEEIRKNVREPRGHQPIIPTHPTHNLGSPDGPAYGLANIRGGWTRLLYGSRIHRDIPNYRSLKRYPKADPYLKKYYDEGVISWRPRTRTRPAGLIVTEPITFRNKLAAAEFLAARTPFQEQWVPI